MSLNFDLQQVKDFNDLWVPTGEGVERRLNTKTERLIFAAMVYDLGEVTEKNVDEWLWRQEFYGRLFDPLYWKNPTEPDNFSREELERHIGLKLNVITKARKAWVKAKMDIYMRANP